MSSNDPPVVWEEFIAYELDDHIRTELLSAIEQTKYGRRYFTYNTFNVVVDADRSTLIVEDELDAARQSELPMAVCAALLMSGLAL